MATKAPDALAGLSLGERAAIGRIEKALFGGESELVRVGRYEIRGVLGSGAFGKVYRAHDPELHREVALKVMEAALRAPDRDELLREARVMATINHPNVAAVHDAGVIDLPGPSDPDRRVRVFIAMELVAGHDLRAWLAAQPRPPAQILAVMRQAGRGLAAAHAAGIVHRDFKPDNVLVGEDGRTRVVDFGLAHPHDHAGPPDDVALDHLTASMAGTPAYMAPEQLAGAPASPITDQFAFCVTLWEAVHGARPFPATTLPELRAALAAPLVPPRVRLLARGTQRAIERGLARDPAARFASVDALLAMIAPRRARWIGPVAFAVLAGVAVTLGAFAMRARAVTEPCPQPVEELIGVWDPVKRVAIGGAFHATGPRGDETWSRVAPVLDRAAASWLAARGDACRATVVRHTQSPELLDRRVACLHDWRRQLAAVTSAFEHATPALVGGATTAVAELPPLARCADPAELTAQPALPTDPALRSRIDALFDQLAELRELHIAGRQAEASELADQIARAAESVGFAPASISAALWQTEALTAAGKLDEGRAMAHRAFDLALAITDHRSAALAAADLAFLGAYDPSRIADSLQWVHTGQALVAKLDDALELDAKLANAEGNLHVAAGDPAAAQPALERAIADFRKLDPEHPDLGSSLAALGSAELDQGKVDAAERELREGISRIERDLGPEHPEVASGLINLALVEGARGFYADAIHSLDRALELQRRVLGPDHPNLAYAYLARAGAYEARGDRPAAERDFVDADRIVRASYGTTHPMLATIGMAYAELLAGLGRGDDAVEHATEARTIAGASDPLTAALAEATLARALAAAHRGPDALRHARAATARADTVLGAPGAIRGIIYQALGDVALGDEAVAALRTAETALTSGAPDPARLARVRLALARALLGSDRAGARAVARDGARDFPRDGDPAVRAAL